MSQSIQTYKNALIQTFRSHPRRYLVFGAFLSVIVIGAAIFWPQTLVLSYSERTCTFQPTIAPGLLRSHSDAFRLEAAQKLKLGNVTLAAMQLCVVPLKAPQEGISVATLSPLGLSVLRKKFTITVPTLPSISMAEVGQKPLPLSRSLSLPLSSPDAVFSYKAVFDGREVSECEAEARALVCSVQDLSLKQGQGYALSIDRYFNGEKVATVASQPIRTLTATAVTAGSIGNGQMVYAKPKSLELTTDKDIATAEMVLVRLSGDQRQELPVNVEYSGKTMIVKWEKDLDRQARFELIAKKITGADGSGLDGEYKLQFETSGGPKVKSVSVGSYKVPIGSTVAITFDQPVLQTQNIGAVVGANGGAKVVGVKGAQVFVSLADVPRCGDVTMTVSDGLQSEHGVTGGSAWRYTTRTLCAAQSTIGTSVKGRAITAYTFGTGTKTILFTGAIHGSEASTRALMLRWIDELEANARALPANTTVVVVPAVNPDGVANGVRVNANNVDLNRNFATSDWKSDITTTSNAPFPGGGGKTSMSEPETRAIAGLVSRLRPQLVLSYHSIGSLVAANQTGASSSLAATYARASGYANTTGASDTFEYGISGTADDYYGQVLGVPSILIELGSHTYHQFERNREAMWSMIRS